MKCPKCKVIREIPGFTVPKPTMRDYYFYYKCPACKHEVAK